MNTERPGRNLNLIAILGVLESLVKIRLPSDLPEREQGRPQVAPLQGLGADCDLNLFKGSNSSKCRGGTCARPCR